MRRVSMLVMTGGLAAIIVVLSKIHAAIVADPPYDYTGSSRFFWSILYGAILVVTSYSAGLPDVPQRRRQIVAAAVLAPVSAALLISMLQLVGGTALLPRFVVGGTAILAMPWLATCNGLARGGRERAEERDRVVLVAGSDDAAALIAELGERPERPATIEAMFTPAEAAQTASGVSPVLAAVHELGATVVVLDRVAQNDQSIVDQVAILHESGIRVRTLSLFYDEWLGKLPAGELERVSLMFDIGEIHRLRYGRIKRLTDLLLGVAGLAALAIVTPIVMVGNFFGNKGDLLFRQTRVGKNGNTFEMLKFRSMVGDDTGSEWTSVDDTRITAFGALLRRSHLDELPQLINILRGDLSLVGPRPEQCQYVEELRTKLPYYDLRHLVQPGLTGWAQVKYGYAGSDRDALEKLQYEFWYLRHQNVAVDLRIIVRTLRSVFLGDGR